MRPRLATALLSLLLPFAALAADPPALQLKPLAQNSKGPDVTPTLNIYGRCGPAVVALLGVSAEQPPQRSPHVIFDASGRPDLQVRTGGKEISFGRDLSDYNRVLCLDTPKGPRLVLAAACSGSGCPGEPEYTLINPATAERLKTHQPCNAQCASLALGVPVAD